MNKQTSAQIQEDIRMFRGVAALLAGLLFLSTVFYHFVEGWRVIDSFYFSVVTLATVGYGDFVPTTDAGKLFATVLIIVGIGSFGAFASLLLKRQSEIRARRRKG